MLFLISILFPSLLPYDDILMNPNSPFGERFDAAIAEMLTGKHSMQITPDDPTLSNKPTDNNEEENGEPF